MAEAQKEFEAIRGTPEGMAKGPDGSRSSGRFGQKMNKLQDELLALTDPAAHGQAALGVRDGKTIGDTEIRIRGEAEKLGPVVPRGFLSLVRRAGRRRRSTQAKRPARAGAVADQPEEPAHAARDGQPRLAASVRPGARQHRR